MAILVNKQRVSGIVGCHEIPHRTTARIAPKYMLGF